MAGLTLQGQVKVLVLAGERSRGDDTTRLDPQNPVVHKAFLDMAGLPMLIRVLQTLHKSGAVEAVSLAVPATKRTAFEGLLSAHLNAYSETIPHVDIVEAEGSPASTILSHLQSLAEGEILLVTTCDHALLTPAMIDSFFEQGDLVNKDILVACVTDTVFRKEYPDARRTFIRLSDMSFSGANLFCLRAGKADGLIKFWRRLEEKRKSPLKMASEIGISTALFYLTGRLSKARLFSIIQRKTETRADLVPLPFANAAIDVDKPEDVTLVRKILAGTQ